MLSQETPLMITKRNQKTYKMMTTLFLEIIFNYFFKTQARNRKKKNAKEPKDITELESEKLKKK